MLKPFHAFLLLLLLLITEETQGAITCEAVTTTYETSATCHFGVDIFQQKLNFNVQFYYPDFKADPVTVLMCNFVTKGEIECKKGKDIQFDYVITDHLTVKGPPNTAQVGGKYVCQVIPSLNVPVNPCNLTFSDATTLATTPTTTTTTQTTGNSLLEEVRGLSIIGLVVGILALVGVVILTVIGIVLLIICRVRLVEEVRKWRTGHQRAADDTEMGDMKTMQTLLPHTRTEAGSADVDVNRALLMEAKRATQVTEPEKGQGQGRSGDILSDDVKAEEGERMPKESWIMKWWRRNKRPPAAEAATPAPMLEPPQMYCTRTDQKQMWRRINRPPAAEAATSAPGPVPPQMHKEGSTRTDQRDQEQGIDMQETSAMLTHTETKEEKKKKEKEENRRSKEEKKQKEEEKKMKEKEEKKRKEEEKATKEEQKRASKQKETKPEEATKTNPEVAQTTGKEKDVKTTAGAYGDKEARKKK